MTTPTMTYTLPQAALQTIDGHIYRVRAALLAIYVRNIPDRSRGICYNLRKHCGEDVRAYGFMVNAFDGGSFPFIDGEFPAPENWKLRMAWCMVLSKSLAGQPVPLPDELFNFLSEECRNFLLLTGTIAPR